MSMLFSRGPSWRFVHAAAFGLVGIVALVFHQWRLFTPLESAVLIALVIVCGLIALGVQARHYTAVAEKHVTEWSRAASAESRRRRALGEITGRTIAAG